MYTDVGRSLNPVIAGGGKKRFGNVVEMRRVRELMKSSRVAVGGHVLAECVLWLTDAVALMTTGEVSMAVRA